MNCKTRKLRNIKIESGEDGDRTNYFVYFENVLVMRKVFPHRGSETSIFPNMLDEVDRLLDILTGEKTTPEK